MKNSKLLTATAVFSVAITVAVTTMSLTAAYRGNSDQNTEYNFGQKRIQISKEQRNAIYEAFENKDYAAWLELAPENNRQSKFTEEDFNAFAEKQSERRAEMETKRAAMDEIFANNDYESWYELMRKDDHNPQILEVIDADNFDKLIEIHSLKQEGQAKFEEVKVLAEELGIELRGQQGYGRQGMKNGMKQAFGQESFKRGYFNK